MVSFFFFISSPFALYEMCYKCYVTSKLQSPDVLGIDETVIDPCIVADGLWVSQLVVYLPKRPKLSNSTSSITLCFFFIFFGFSLYH